MGETIVLRQGSADVREVRVQEGQLLLKSDIYIECDGDKDIVM